MKAPQVGWMCIIGPKNPWYDTWGGTFKIVRIENDTIHIKHTTRGIGGFSVRSKDITWRPMNKLELSLD